MKEARSLSIVVPVYMGEESLPQLVSEIHLALKSRVRDYEIILVNDFSPDRSWEVIQRLCEEDDMIKGISFSRNFGQHVAIRAGLEASTKDYVCVMDCDLQHNPRDILGFLDLVEDGFEIVVAKSEERAHSRFKNLTAYLFYKVYNSLVGQSYLMADPYELNFSLISRKVVASFLKLKYRDLHYLMALRWIGFKRTYMVVEQRKRRHGKSSYNLMRLIAHAWNGIIVHSDRILMYTVKTGVGFCIFSILFATLLIVRYFIFGAQAGWTSLFVMILFSTGIQLSSMGIIGLYVGKVFEEVKQQPLYVIDETINIFGSKTH